MLSATRKSILTRVLSVTLGLPEPWMCPCVKKQRLPGLALICWLSLSNSAVIWSMLRRSSIAFLINSRERRIGMICIERLRSSSLAHRRTASTDCATQCRGRSPLAERKSIGRIVDDLRIPCRGQTLLDQ